ncbi:asparaginase [Devosia sp. A449]
MTAETVATPVVVIGLGGTIAMAPGAQPGVTPTLTADQLLGAVPELAAFTGLRAESFRMLPGAHLSFDDIVQLAAHINDLAAAGTQGVVITQGTDTIEETAFALDLLVVPDIAVVVTGAMRNPSLSGADGPANLLAAIRVAASSEARQMGVVVVLNDEIHAAQFVAKRHSTSPSAFVSLGGGVIGGVSEGRVHFHTRPLRAWRLPRHKVTGSQRVALLRLSLDDQGELIHAAVEAGFAGLVIEGVGGGHASPNAAAALERAATAIPVVLASRAGNGEVLRSTYGFVGGEIDLQRRGVVLAGQLDGLKARVLLTLLLRADCAGDVKQIFAGPAAQID